MNLYFVLGVQQEATANDIRRAYRRLARRFHPDINPGDPEAVARFRLIQEAYETLLDPARRGRYDATGVASPVVETSHVEFAGFDFTAKVDGPRASTFGDLFAGVFEGATGRPENGADLQVPMGIAFEVAARGGTVPLEVRRLERCAPCNGAGMTSAPDARCSLCDGAGELRGARGHMVFARTCPRCGGRGRLRHRLCQACGGEGVGMSVETVAVPVPAGAMSGLVINLAGHGHAGRRGGAHGNLRVSVAVLPHKVFRRDGDDLVLDVPVAIHEAALGARIEVPGLDGPVPLRIPQGTPVGQRFRLRGRGMPSLGSGDKGDLVVTIRIVLPRVLDERSKALLREFGQINQENVRSELFG